VDEDFFESQIGGAEATKLTDAEVADELGEV
jgi:hypothetical protein